METADAARIAAEQAGVSLQEKLQQQLQEAVEASQASLRDTLAEKDKALTEAQTKSTEAEGKLFFDRIQALPELAPYEVNVKVKVPTAK